MSGKKQGIILSVILIILSIILYFVHFYIFHDAHHIMIYLVGDLAFLPLEMLFVSLIFHKLLEDAEKRNSLKKVNMVIGAFYTQMGTALICALSVKDRNFDALRKNLIFTADWSRKDFTAAVKTVESYDYGFSSLELPQLKDLLQQQRTFLLKVIENPILLEHELFSELLMAVSHLCDELCARVDLTSLPENDREHIKADAARAYKLLLKQWMLYIEHMKKEYPYLFSFAVRTNPFDSDAKPQID